MVHYVMLLKYSPKGIKTVRDDPTVLTHIEDALKRWEAEILSDFHLLGEYDQCLIVDAPDNFKAYRAALAHELSDTADTEILPAIDLNLFKEMMARNFTIEGPHHWQTSWWAKLVRLFFRYDAYGKYIWKYCDPIEVYGRHHFKGVKGPCIVVGNHTSMADPWGIFWGLPQRIKYNIYSGAAADRWFVKRPERKEFALKPWYLSLTVGSFPIQRGGGSRALDYSKWLLEKNCNLLIFPEGTRSTSRTMAKFRHGVAILALEKNVPVVPCYLTGFNQLRAKGSSKLQPAPCSVNFLEPIHFETGTEVPDATRQIYDALNNVHKEVIDRGPDAARMASMGIEPVALTEPSEESVHQEPSASPTAESRNR